MRIIRRIRFSHLAAVVSAGAAYLWLGSGLLEPDLPVPAALKAQFNKNDILRFEDRLPSDSTMQEVLLEYGFSPQQIHQLIEQTRDVYNLNRVQAGHRISVERYSDGRLRGLEYGIDDQTELLVNYDGDRFYASRRQRTLLTRVRGISGVIEDNFFNAVVNAGERDSLAMNVLDILRWDVDFTTIQPQDAFELLFESKLDDGNFARYGDVLATRFDTGGRTFTAFRFLDPVSGKFKYYDFNGKSVRKAFLKVPFKYDYRISSGFSYSRFHPVLKRRRPHLGVDFAAPYGTPVLSSGSGRVVFAGRKGGNGNMVQIRHPNGYTTSYLHLSRIFVRNGRSVQQGQRIGAVGATGLVTGAHLDYRIQDGRGKYLNPKKRIAWPSDTAVPASHMKEFIAARDAFLEQLEAESGRRQATDNATMAGD